MAQDDPALECYNAAVRTLGYRSRSEAELRQKLARRKFEPALIDRTLSRLKEQKFLDDASFAASWTEDRQTSRPRSRRMIQYELKRKGVAAETIEQVTGSVDDEAGAYQAAQKRMRLLGQTDYQTFLRKMGDFLRRRGFSYEVISRTCRRLWRERDVGPERD